MHRAKRILLGIAALALAAGMSAAQLGGGGTGGALGGALGGPGGGIDTTSGGGIFNGGGINGGGGFGGGRQGGNFGGGGGGRGGRGGGGGGRGMNGEFLQGNEPMRPIPADRNGVPKWDVDPHFKNDAFTFVRLRFTTAPGGRQGGQFGGGFGYRSGGTATSWLNDWPDSDLDLSFRLQQMTSMKVNPEPIQLQITDERLLNYPFAYMLQVGRLEFTDAEREALRRWLLNGGFLMVDDHWGPDQGNWAQQIARVFPDRPQEELTLDHPIFHCVFDLKEIPQVPPIQLWMQWARTGQPERSWRNADDPPPHYRAIKDDRGRIMVLECGNTDLGDAWEREGVNEQYFHIFAESRGYPMAINIIFYMMTH